MCRQAHARFKQDAARHRAAPMLPGHRLPNLSEGDHAGISTSDLLSDSFDSKSPTRFVGPFVTVALQNPTVCEFELESSFPMSIHIRVDLNKPFMRLSNCALRPGEVDIPLVGEASPTRGRRRIQQLVARAPVRGCPPFSSRRSYHSAIRFKAPDTHFDVWISEEDAPHEAH
jgi:hypothetical protein